jgi:hypothetical protein
MCLHPKLVLMENDWLVLVAVGQQEMIKLRKRLRKGLMVMMMRGEEETYIVDEINPSSYTHMGTPTFRIPLNLDWREKINYKCKTDLVREKRGKFKTDYRFHTTFQ